MSNSGESAGRLLDLAGAVCNGLASADEAVELNSILHNDHVSRRRFVEYCRVHVALRCQLKAPACRTKSAATDRCPNSFGRPGKCQRGIDIHDFGWFARPHLPHFIVSFRLRLRLRLDDLVLEFGRL